MYVLRSLENDSRERERRERGGSKGLETERLTDFISGVSECNLKIKVNLDTDCSLSQLSAIYL